MPGEQTHERDSASEEATRLPLSRREIWVAIAVAAIWLFFILFISSSGSALVTVPYFGLAYLAYRLIERPRSLVWAWLALHTLTCVIIAGRVLLTMYGVGRAIQSLPIFYIDLPVTFPFLFVEVPQPFFLAYTFLIGGLFWGAAAWFLARERDSQKVAAGEGSPRQFTLLGLLLITAVIGIWLALMLSEKPGPGLFTYLAPFFFALYLARRFILRPLGLAITYFLIHAVACGITLYLMLQSTDGTERWMISLPLVILDLPVTFIFAFGEPPGLLFPMYIFLVGGFFWAIIGWYIAQKPY
jgi:hypothetical protein